MAILPVPPWLASEAQLPNFRRQDTPEGSQDCTFVSNGVISCYPTSTTKVFQNTSMHFVWNAKQPAFAQFNRVDVFLKHQDTLQLAAEQLDIPNQPGRTAFNVNDSWWEPKGNLFNGTNIDYPMYFIIVPAGADTLTAPPQSTFTAVQTRVPDSILALQESSASAAAASSSEAAASLSSVLATATSSPATSSGASGRGSPGPSNTSTSGGSGLQHSSGNGEFPAWAIALLVIFGTLALVFVLLAIWLGLRRYRRRSGRGGALGKSGSLRESMGSHTPMMAEVAPTGQQPEEPGSPGAVSSSQGHQSFIPPAALGSIGGAAGSSRAGSTHTKDTDAPFSGADAAIMAAAFRDRLRKPDFATRPLEEGESPEKELDDDEREAEEREMFLQSQLKEEGRDLRSVSSSRGVRIYDHERQGTGETFDLPSVDSGPG